MSPASDLGGPRPRSALSGPAGLLPRQAIRELVGRKVLRATDDIRESQFQPASLRLPEGHWRMGVESRPLDLGQNVRRDGI